MNNSKTQAKKMSKRLRKKYHIGEFTRYCARVVYVASDSDSLQKLCNSDEFIDKSKLVYRYSFKTSITGLRCDIAEGSECEIVK